MNHHIHVWNVFIVSIVMISLTTIVVVTVVLEVATRSEGTLTNVKCKHDWNMIECLIHLDLGALPLNPL